jgi:hypothetical protein
MDLDPVTRERRLKIRREIEASLPRRIAPETIDGASASR